MKYLLLLLITLCITGCFDIPVLMVTPNDYNDSSDENLIDSVLNDTANQIVIRDSIIEISDTLPALAYLSESVKKWYFRSYSGGYSFTGNWGSNEVNVLLFSIKRRNDTLFSIVEDSTNYTEIPSLVYRDSTWQRADTTKQNGINAPMLPVPMNEYDISPAVKMSDGSWSFSVKYYGYRDFTIVINSSVGPIYAYQRTESGYDGTFAYYLLTAVDGKRVTGAKLYNELQARWALYNRYIL